MSGSADDELARRIDELEAELRAVKAELKQSTRRGPFGIPRPPSPSEVLRFTDQAAIPAAIAVLEANIRILEGIRRGIQLVETGEVTRRTGTEMGAEAAQLSSRALDEFDAAIRNLETIVSGTPADVAGQDILAEARRLRRDLEERISSAERQVAKTGNHDRATDPDEKTSIDIEAELESIKREQGGDDDDDDDSADRSDPRES